VDAETEAPLQLDDVHTLFAHRIPRTGTGGPTFNSLTPLGRALKPVLEGVLQGETNPLKAEKPDRSALRPPCWHLILFAGLKAQRWTTTENVAWLTVDSFRRGIILSPQYLKKRRPDNYGSCREATKDRERAALSLCRTSGVSLTRVRRFWSPYAFSLLPCMQQNGRRFSKKTWPPYRSRRAPPIWAFQLLSSRRYLSWLARVQADVHARRAPYLPIRNRCHKAYLRSAFRRASQQKNP